MFEKDVIISVKGTQGTKSGDPILLELVTEGKYYQEKDEFVVVYEETEITGMSGTTTSVSISPGKVILTRTGSVNSQLIFEEGQRHVSYYDTAHGAFTIGVLTNFMDVSINDFGGELMVDYQLEVDNESTGVNDFYMKIREA
jgi:uncharacterized beta-barrel protein YwiB (DUF1934 family)